MATACKQSTHTHQEIHREPHLKHDKFTKLTEEEHPLNQRLPASNIFVHLQTSCEAMMSFTRPPVNEYMNWNYLFISNLYFLIIISFNLTQKDIMLWVAFDLRQRDTNKQLARTSDP